RCARQKLSVDSRHRSDHERLGFTKFLGLGTPAPIEIRGGDRLGPSAARERCPPKLREEPIRAVDRVVDEDRSRTTVDDSSHPATPPSAACSTSCSTSCSAVEQLETMPRIRIAIARAASLLIPKPTLDARIQKITRNLTQYGWRR